MAHHLMTLLEAASLIGKGPDGNAIRFLFLGDGAEKAALKARAMELGLGNTVFVDSVPRSEVPHYWSLVDTSIIHLKRAPLFETVIPSKLFECMAMGIPVLHGVPGESARIVERKGAGLSFESQNAAQLADLIGRLYRNPSELAALSDRALAASKHYDRKAMAALMLQTLIATEAKTGRRTAGQTRAEPRAK
jgi:glycosyltransferase involved in cell wall biosynthesis